MRNRFYLDHRIMFHLFLAALFFLITPVWAKDWQQLQDLTDVQLSEKISEFQKSLDQNSSDYEALKALGIAYHIKARKDAKKFAPRAVEFLSRAYDINKKDYENMCYLSSATTMMAKTTWNPIKKMSYVNKGTGLMDKAVRRDTNNISVRMTRAFNSKSLPSFLNRGEIAFEDFEYLADLIEKNPESYALIKKEVYTNLAELYKKAGDQVKAEKFRKLADSL
jgi:cytochrome c-type biogenesis protein CcmH/NrfG